mgnify:CR=1 FL=1
MSICSNQRQACLESFTKETFNALVFGLLDEGYIIDGRKTQEISFSSTQIEHLDQDVFNELCKNSKLLLL